MRNEGARDGRFRRMPRKSETLSKNASVSRLNLVASIARFQRSREFATMGTRAKPRLSAAARARIAAAQRARWARVKGGRIVPIASRQRRKLSATALARIRAVQKAAGQSGGRNTARHSQTIMLFCLATEGPSRLSHANRFRLVNAACSLSHAYSEF
jgi:hypothetical protein